jgi:hypothetical protein
MPYNVIVKNEQNLSTVNFQILSFCDSIHLIHHNAEFDEQV